MVDYKRNQILEETFKAIKKYHQDGILDYGEYTVDALFNVIDSREKEIEHWKEEYRKAEQSYSDLSWSTNPGGP